VFFQSLDYDISKLSLGYFKIIINFVELNA